MNYEFGRLKPPFLIPNSSFLSLQPQPVPRPNSVVNGLIELMNDDEQYPHAKDDLGDLVVLRDEPAADKDASRIDQDVPAIEPCNATEIHTDRGDERNENEAAPIRCFSQSHFQRIK